MVFSILFGLFGLACLIGIAWLFSNNKSRVDWRLVATGVSLQIAFAAVVLNGPRVATWLATQAPGLYAIWGWMTLAVAAAFVVAAILFAPYAAWVGFASLLNGSIFALRKAALEQTAQAETLQAAALRAADRRLPRARRPSDLRLCDALYRLCRF